MEIGSISSIGSISEAKKSSNSSNDSGISFADMLKQAMNDVNKEQVEAYNAMEEIATGRVKNLQKAVQQIEEADLSLRLALETKNKAINAYKQVMQMQV